MKTITVKFMIYIAKKIMSCIYTILKLLPVSNNKIVFCSRQGNEIPLDFRLIQNKLHEKNSDLLCINICRHVGGGIKHYILFMFAVLKSMYYMATSKICIIDSYWPAVSMLEHKQSLKVIQIWHSIGKIKKSGYQTIGKVSGRKTEYVDILCMHRNYDFVIAGASSWNRFYCESFGVQEEKILNYGLPRIDYLIDTAEQNRERFFRENPEYYGKKIILYVPTFRRNMHSRCSEITDAFDNNDALLIIKAHPGQEIERKDNLKNVCYMDRWETIDLLAVCDCIITDYSAISLEAAVLDKKIYYWIYDYDEYIKNNGLNIDLKKEMEGNLYNNIEDLFKAISENRYEEDCYKNFRMKYLPETVGDATEKITGLVLGLLEKEAYEKKYYENCNYG